MHHSLRLALLFSLAASPAMSTTDCWLSDTSCNMDPSDTSYSLLEESQQEYQEQNEEDDEEGTEDEEEHQEQNEEDDEEGTEDEEEYQEQNEEDDEGTEDERGGRGRGGRVEASAISGDAPTPGDAVAELKANMEEREKFFEEAVKSHSLSASELEVHAEFKKFLQKNVRHYFQKKNVSEYVQRLKNFKNSIIKAGVRTAVEKTRSTHKRPAIHGITKFSDYHDHEVHALAQGEGMITTENYTCAHVVEEYGCGLELQVMNMSQLCPESCSGASPPSLVSMADSRRRRRGDSSSSSSRRRHSSSSRRRHSSSSRRRHSSSPSPPSPPSHSPSPSSPSPSPSPPSPPSPVPPTRSPTGSCTNWATYLEVRSQGHCGDCWGMSTVECVRVTYAAQHGENPGKLSVRYLVDCMQPGKVCWKPKGKPYHHKYLTGKIPKSIEGYEVSDMMKNGCCGGHINLAMDFIMNSGGIPTQADYGDIINSTWQPDEKKFYPCKSGIRKAVTVTGALQLNTEDAMASYICKTGPISVAVKTESWIDTYIGGVVSAPKSGDCGSGGHSVLLVGLNKDDNAWIVQNSWGSDYGVTVDGKTLASSSAHRDYLHGSYCSHLVEQGCSLTVEAAIEAIHKVMQFDLKGNWESSGKTVADECPKSCAALNEKGGYVYMEYGKDICTITHSAYVPKSTAKVSPNPSPSPSQQPTPAPTPPALNTPVLIKSYRGENLQDNNGNLDLTTNTGTWEKWTKVSAGDGKYFIRSHRGANLQDHNGNAYLTNNTGTWEKWTIVSAGEGKHFIRSHEGKNLQDAHQVSVRLTTNADSSEKWSFVENA